MPKKRPRRRVATGRPRPLPTAVNHVWAYDFVFDTCADGRTLKCLTVIDELTRECLAIDVAGGIRSGRVIEVPWQNGEDESFNGKFRDQHLSLRWFRNRADAKVSIEEWRRHYSEVRRPHSSLAYSTPAAFTTKHLADGDGGRLARADMSKNGERLTGPIIAILH